MGKNVTRRQMLTAAGISVAVAAAKSAKGAAKTDTPIKIIGISTSLRAGRTTATALRICLEAAKGSGAGVEVELIDLAGLKIPGGPAAGLPLAKGQGDDFPELAKKLTDAKVGGIIVGTPVYFGNMSGLCKTFLDRCTVFRKSFALRNKVGGVLAVAGGRNGGQEITIQSVHAALLGQDMIIVGDGKPTSHLGATLWSGAKGGITADKIGLATAKNLGRRVAEVARMIASAAR